MTTKSLNNKSISVVLLVLNNSRVIGKCLESIRNSNINQVVVVDGSSTDNTVEVAKKYTDDVFVSEKGKWKQQKLALSKIKSDYIIFAEVDQFYPKDFFNNFLDEFLKTDYFGMGGSLDCYFKRNFYEKGINEFYKIHHYDKGVVNIFGGPAIFNFKEYIKYTDLEGWNGFSVDTRRAQIFEENNLKLGLGKTKAYQYQELDRVSFIRKYTSYGKGDYVFYSFNYKNWTLLRKLKSLTHVFRRYVIVYPLKSIYIGNPFIAIPYLWASAAVRYWAWLMAFLKVYKI